MTVQTAPAAPAHRPPSRPVKSPLAAHSHGTTVIARTRINPLGTRSALPAGAARGSCLLPAAGPPAGRDL
jgi:hypothetical protein